MPPQSAFCLQPLASTSGKGLLLCAEGFYVVLVGAPLNSIHIGPVVNCCYVLDVTAYDRPDVAPSWT